MFVALALLVWMMSHHGECCFCFWSMYVRITFVKRNGHQNTSDPFRGRPEVEYCNTHYEYWAGAPDLPYRRPARRQG